MVSMMIKVLLFGLVILGLLGLALWGRQRLVKLERSVGQIQDKVYNLMGQRRHGAIVGPPLSNPGLPPASLANPSLTVGTNLPNDNYAFTGFPAPSPGMIPTATFHEEIGRQENFPGSPSTGLLREEMPVGNAYPMAEQVGGEGPSSPMAPSALAPGGDLFSSLFSLISGCSNLRPAAGNAPPPTVTAPTEPSESPSPRFLSPQDLSSASPPEIVVTNSPVERSDESPCRDDPRGPGEEGQEAFQESGEPLTTPKITINLPGTVEVEKIDEAEKDRVDMTNPQVEMMAIAPSELPNEICSEAIITKTDTTSTSIEVLPITVMGMPLTPYQDKLNDQSKHPESDSEGTAHSNEARTQDVTPLVEATKPSMVPTTAGSNLSKFTSAESPLHKIETEIKKPFPTLIPTVAPKRRGRPPKAIKAV